MRIFIAIKQEVRNPEEVAVYVSYNKSSLPTDGTLFLSIDEKILEIESKKKLLDKIHSGTEYRAEYRVSELQDLVHAIKASDPVPNVNTLEGVLGKPGASLLRKHLEQEQKYTESKEADKEVAPSVHRTFQRQTEAARALLYSPDEACRMELASVATRLSDFYKTCKEPYEKLAFLNRLCGPTGLANTQDISKLVMKTKEELGDIQTLEGIEIQDAEAFNTRCDAFVNSILVPAITASEQVSDIWSRMCTLELLGDVSSMMELESSQESARLPKVIVDHMKAKWKDFLGFSESTLERSYANAKILGMESSITSEQKTEKSIQDTSRSVNIADQANKRLHRVKTTLKEAPFPESKWSKANDPRQHAADFSRNILWAWKALTALSEDDLESNEVTTEAGMDARAACTASYFIGTGHFNALDVAAVVQGVLKESKEEEFSPDSLRTGAALPLDSLRTGGAQPLSREQASAFSRRATDFVCDLISDHIEEGALKKLITTRPTYVIADALRILKQGVILIALEKAHQLDPEDLVGFSQSEPPKIVFSKAGWKKIDAKNPNPFPNRDKDTRSVEIDDLDAMLTILEPQIVNFPNLKKTLDPTQYEDLTQPLEDIELIKRCESMQMMWKNWGKPGKSHLLSSHQALQRLLSMEMKNPLVRSMNPQSVLENGLSIEYQCEIYAQQVYGAKILELWHEYLMKAPSGGGSEFYAWLHALPAHELEAKAEAASVAGISRVKYMTEKERIQYKLNFTASNTVTGQIPAPNPVPPSNPEKDVLEIIYVCGYIGQQLEFVGAPKIRGTINHSSFFAGTPVEGAGRILLKPDETRKKWVIKSMDNNSGHTKPDDLMTLHTLERLEQLGLNLANIAWESKWGAVGEREETAAQALERLRFSVGEARLNSVPLTEFKPLEDPPSKRFQKIEKLVSEKSIQELHQYLNMRAHKIKLSEAPQVVLLIKRALDNNTDRDPAVQKIKQALSQTAMNLLRKSGINPTQFEQELKTVDPIKPLSRTAVRASWFSANETKERKAVADRAMDQGAPSAGEQQASGAADPLKKGK